MDGQIDQGTQQAWDAVAKLHQSYFTGCVLAASMRLGAARAAELVYQIFCRQRMQRFLPGLKKLGIDQLPPAVAAAQYHYLSNNMGGVAVEYMYENDRKAWIRYSAPRWLWSGNALCGIPSEVSVAMLRGWHAQNGVSLGVPALGFVCTKQAADGQSGLEGYYCEYDRPLEAQERLRFSRFEDAPDFDPAKAPVLASDSWPEARLRKARRNYAMEYVRTLLPTAVDLFGPDEAVATFGVAAYKVGYQYYHEMAAALGLPPGKSAPVFADFVVRLVEAQGDAVYTEDMGEGIRITQSGWGLFKGSADFHPAVFDCFSRLLVGALDAHNHRLTLASVSKSFSASPEFVWLLR